MNEPSSTATLDFLLHSIRQRTLPCSNTNSTRLVLLFHRPFPRHSAVRRARLRHRHATRPFLLLGSIHLRHLYRSAHYRLAETLCGVRLGRYCSSLPFRSRRLRSDSIWDSGRSVTSPNHALQRTAPCVTAPASAATFPPTMQVPRRTPRSLSLRSLGDFAHVS